MTAPSRIAFVRCLELPALDDLSALDAAFAAGRPRAGHVVALLAKTQGDGGPADTSRAAFVASARALLARHLAIPPEAVDERVAFVVSGGIEASAAPHMIVLARAPAARPAQGTALAIGRHVSAAVPAAVVGTAAHIEAAAAAVRAALADGGLQPRAAHLALIKGPAAAGPAGISAARAATALGAAVALGEISSAAATAAWRKRDLAVWSARVAVSSAGEFPCHEVVVLGNARGWSGDLRIAHRAMADLVDLRSVVAGLGELGLVAAPQLSRTDRARLVATIAKGGPPPDEMLRGVPMGLSADSSQPAFRRVRGALAGTIVAATGDPFAFVSGGSEHQGPPGGGLVAFVAKVRR
ncbi:MAG: cyanuric acid amidohydrolase [Alphaproteobacteria bacterium]|nr:cyanuric acid amidohydrolase [Alphaproteobacteria bacterium]